MKTRFIKTYAAKGLLECKMSLRIGKAVLTINFTGGSMGGNGVISAKYATGNAAIQTLIEGSAQFQSGKVYLHKKEEIAATAPCAPDNNCVTTPDIPGNESEDRAIGKESGRADGRDSDPYV